MKLKIDLDDIIQKLYSEADDYELEELRDLLTDWLDAIEAELAEEDEL
jgi:hypothetical protein